MTDPLAIVSIPDAAAKRGVTVGDLHRLVNRLRAAPGASERRLHPEPTSRSGGAVLMKLFLASTLAAAALLGAAPAGADPASCGFNDPRLCSPGKVFWCPDSHQWVSWLQYCPSLSQGPYLPGGRTPDGGLAQ